VIGSTENKLWPLSYRYAPGPFRLQGD
jgi:hypothetical protein